MVKTWTQLSIPTRQWSTLSPNIKFHSSSCFLECAKNLFLSLLRLSHTTKLNADTIAVIQSSPLNPITSEICSAIMGQCGQITEVNSVSQKILFNSSKQSLLLKYQWGRMHIFLSLDVYSWLCVDSNFWTLNSCFSTLEEDQSNQITSPILPWHSCAWQMYVNLCPQLNILILC